VPKCLSEIVFGDPIYTKNEFSWKGLSSEQLFCRVFAGCLRHAETFYRPHFLFYSVESRTKGTMILRCGGRILNVAVKLFDSGQSFMASTICFVWQRFL